ncbi:MAG: serine/threonine protein kinase [Bacteroidia bacterium]|nr:serine/threonine protein kinase [Bacteroidia bacterium]
MSALLGKKLLNYRIEKLLGQGGMGEVYLGVHTEIGRKVAIKVISPHLARDPRIQERFKREALILAKLNHPNIVQLYDYWARPDEGLYLIMEYVEGISLDRYIHRVLRGPVPPKQAIEIFLQVLDAFQYAHDNGVIHRDIKPSNILIRNDNVAKVLDFGIARIVTPDPTTASEEMALTKTGTTLGTVVYMSPEQLKAKSPLEIDHRSDIYSLGVVFFEMLVGREMYDRSQLSEFDILIKIASEPPPLLSELNPTIAPDFENILSKALAKKPEERYSSCQSFAADLLRILPKYTSAEESPVLKNPALTQTQVGGSSEQTSFLHRTYARIKASLQSKQGASFAKTALFRGLLLIAIIGGGIAFWVWQQNRQEKKEIFSLAQTFVQALNTHDKDIVEGLLHPQLKPFFNDPIISRDRAIQKYFSSFWSTLEKDSVAWVEEPAITREGDSWFVRGWLYQSYTTKPQTFLSKEPERIYNKWFRRYETRQKVVTKTLPPTTACKIKEIYIQFYNKKIKGIQVLGTKECS